VSHVLQVRRMHFHDLMLIKPLIIRFANWPQIKKQIGPHNSLIARNSTKQSCQCVSRVLQVRRMHFHAILVWRVWSAGGGPPPL
jgi:hypothetical protein